MKKVLFLAIAFLVVAALPVATAETQDTGKNSYIGVAGCAMCHKTAKQGEQDKLWRASKHAQAYQTLLSDESKKIAKDKGLSAEPHKAEQCLKCHATGHNVDASRLEAKFKIEDGVQCETCHGPGSAYKTMKIMKDKAAAVAAGLFIPENTEAYCVTCHNQESPTYKPFNFKESLAKIAHPVPK